MKRVFFTGWLVANAIAMFGPQPCQALITADEFVATHYDAYAIDTSGSEPLIAVRIQTNGDRTELHALGVDTVVASGAYVLPWIPIDQISAIGMLPSVVSIAPTSWLYPNLDASRPYIGATQVHSSAGGRYTGKGVITGFVDSGIDVAIPDFKDATDKTRILYIWDQKRTDNPKPGGIYDYGSEWSKSDIDAGSYVPLPPMTTTDPFGHGTHVAGILAGNGGAESAYCGIAPDADIICVALGRKPWTQRDVVMGMKYIMEKARELDRPCVINLSVGSNKGPRDGSSGFELDIKTEINIHTFFDRKNAFSVVVAAGNTGFDGNNPEVIQNYKWNSYWGDKKNHARLNGDGEVIVDVDAFGDVYADKLYLEIFYTPSLFTAFTLTAPVCDDLGDSVDTYVFGPYEAGEGFGAAGVATPFSSPNGMLGYVCFQNDMYNSGYPDPYPQSTSNRLLMVINSGRYQKEPWTRYPLCAGEWKITGTNVVGDWDVYLTESKHAGNRVHTVSPYANSHQINEPGNIDSVITVGSINTKNTWVTDARHSEPSYSQGFVQAGYPAGDVTFFSSPGPTRAGLVKPELYAPGAWVASALAPGSDYSVSEWHNASDGNHRHTQGTSQSAPHVAGVIALMMEKNPSLSMTEIRNILIANKAPNGCVNAFATVQATPSCCAGSKGNVDCDESGMVDIGDVTVMISNLFVHLGPFCCRSAGDFVGAAPGDPPDGNLDFGDLTKLMEHLFITLEPLPACP